MYSDVWESNNHYDNTLVALEQAVGLNARLVTMPLVTMPWGRLLASTLNATPLLQAVGLNARFRCYKYQGGDYFKFHTDGSWPGSLAVTQPGGGGQQRLVYVRGDVYCVRVVFCFDAMVLQ